MHASQIQGCVVEQRVKKKRKIAESVCSPCLSKLQPAKVGAFFLRHSVDVML